VVDDGCQSVSRGNRSQLPRAGNGKKGKERFRYRISEPRVTEQRCCVFERDHPLD